MIKRTLLLSTLALGCAHASSSSHQILSERPTPAAKQVPAATARAEGTEDLEAMLRGDVLHFDYDASNLQEPSRRRLQNIADVLAKHPQLTVRVEGNCDERGTEDYNLHLGQARADAARKYLMDLGIDGSRVSTLSYGKDRPANPAHSPDAWAENRRDDIRPTGNL